MARGEPQREPSTVLWLPARRTAGLAGKQSPPHYAIPSINRHENRKKQFDTSGLMELLKPLRLPDIARLALSPRSPSGVKKQNIPFVYGATQKTMTMISTKRDPPPSDESLELLEAGCEGGGKVARTPPCSTKNDTCAV